MYRIVKKSKGWVVEQKHKTFFGLSYWKFCVTPRGIELEPWYHSTYDHAMNSLIDLVKLQTNNNSKMF